MTISPDQASNLNRFSGFADVYDGNRPQPPAALGALLASYADASAPSVVDLGSGTGLSSRWAAGWAASVIGIEPNDDMRAIAETKRHDRVTYRRGVGHDTGLHDGVADVVVAVQSFQWMEPDPTLAEITRLLRPGGVFAAIDCQWPPVTGVMRAEQAWVAFHHRVTVFEARITHGESGDELRRPLRDDDPSLSDDDVTDPHSNRAMPGAMRSWPKRQHLERLVASGLFVYTREVFFDEAVDGGVDRFIALMNSQGAYRGLLRFGLTEQEVGFDDFEREVRAGFAAAAAPPRLSFSWRVRLGVRPTAASS